MTQKKYSSSFSWQLSENKPNTKLVLLCLEFNKPNKQSVYYINLFKKINLTRNLDFRRECSSPFQGTTASKVQLTTAPTQPYRNYEVSPIRYQTDLRITNHRGHKFSPSLTLLSFKTRIEWPSVLTETGNFLNVFF